MTRWQKSASGALCCRRPSLKAIFSPFWTVFNTRTEDTEHVAHPYSSSAPHQRDRRDCCRGALFRTRVATYAHRHFSRSEPSGHLRSPAVRRNESAADGRIHFVLLRVPLPLYQWHRERRSEVDPGHGFAQAYVPSWNKHE